MRRKEITLLSYNSGTPGGMGTDGFTTDPGPLHIIFSHCLVLSFKDTNSPFLEPQYRFFF